MSQNGMFRLRVCLVQECSLFCAFSIACNLALLCITPPMNVCLLYLSAAAEHGPANEAKLSSARRKLVSWRAGRHRSRLQLNVCLVPA